MGILAGATITRFPRQGRRRRARRQRTEYWRERKEREEGREIAQKDTLLKRTSWGQWTGGDDEEPGEYCGLKARLSSAARVTVISELKRLAGKHPPILLSVLLSSALVFLLCEHLEVPLRIPFLVHPRIGSRLCRLSRLQGHKEKFGEERDSRKVLPGDHCDFFERPHPNFLLVAFSCSPHELFSKSRMRKER